PAEMDAGHTYPGGLTVGETKANAVAMQQALLMATRAPVLPAANGSGSSNGNGNGRSPDARDEDPPPSEQRAQRITRVTARLLTAGSDLGLDAVWRANDDRARSEELPYEIAAMRQFAAERADILREFATLAAAGHAVDDRVVQEALRRIE